MSSEDIYVVKRTGEKEPLDYDKINRVLLWATENINGVSASDVAMNAQLQIHQNISTDDIHQVLINSAVDMITEETPNYQYVASKLLNFLLRKRVFNTYDNFPRLKDFINDRINLGVYDKNLADKYSDYDYAKIERFIKHDRDEELTYAGIQQLMDKYLLKDRSTGEQYETPQFAYIAIAMTLFADREGKERLRMIKECYDLISKHVISLPTPILAGVRTPNRQFSSCTLIDMDDTLDSIGSSNHAIMKYISKRAGIGVNMRLRGVGSRIREGEVVHTGIIPFVKMTEATVKSCSQGGIRGGAATVYYPFWHNEIEDIVVLKNNRGNDLNRARRLDHAIQLSRLFYRRFLADEDITLFSPSEVPELYEAFGDNDRFDELYEKYERSYKVRKKKIKARELMGMIARERVETGRIYIMNIDNVNIHSPFKDKIYQSNLCTEVNLPTTPLQHIDDGDDTDAEIALCVLAAYNLGAIKSDEELERAALYACYILDYVIDMQDYPVPAARKMLKRRSLGIGVTNFAYWLAKQGLNYDSAETPDAVDELFEKIQYYTLKASNELAKEFGACEWFDRTKYSEGVMPVDRYSKAVDNVTSRKHSEDWDNLRKEIVEHGLRNSVVTAIMPCESSSLPMNATNGIEGIRSLIITKRSKAGGPLPVVAPEMMRLKNKYQLAWEYSNESINKIVSVIQKWIDQGISVNHYYDPRQFENDEIPVSQIVRDILQFYQYGGKQLYYANSKDYKSDDLNEMVNNKNMAEESDISDNSYEDDLGCDSGACAL